MAAMYQQDVALTGRNPTGPLRSVGCLTAQAPADRPRA